MMRVKRNILCYYIKRQQWIDYKKREVYVYHQDSSRKGDFVIGALQKTKLYIGFKYLGRFRIFGRSKITRRSS